MANTRYGIIACVVTLMCIGTLAVYSGAASPCGAERGHLAIARRQMLWTLIAAVTMMIFARVDYHLLEKLAGPILIGSFVALAAVHLVGVELNGARRWIRLGPMSIQPSEFFKIAILIYMARFLSAKQKKIRQFLHGFVPPMILAMVGFFLIVTQPDFGTAVLIAAVVYAMLVVAGVNLLHALPMLMATIPILIYIVVTVPYRLRRILIFLDPWKDPSGAGYHVVQSLIAFGSGGLTGVGPGLGMQKTGFIPEHLTDFAFSIIGEETGFVGTAGVVFVYLLLLYLGSRVVRMAPDGFGSILAFGILLLIALQTVINIGVVTSLLPTKGLPLPFISAGGSSMLAMSAGVGVLLNIALHAEREEPVYLPGAQRAAI